MLAPKARGRSWVCCSPPDVLAVRLCLHRAHTPGTIELCHLLVLDPWRTPTHAATVVAPRAQIVRAMDQRALHRMCEHLQSSATL